MNIYAEFAKARGRQYDAGWTVEAIARILRREAERGFLRGVDPKLDARYQQACSARHEGTSASVVFTRDNVPRNALGWHCSLCFIGVDCYLPWDEEAAERWLTALYGVDRPAVVAYGPQSAIGAAKGVRHFLLPVERW
jgi:hypothetical protein